ncbi:MAG: serine/threonine-protein kinase [Bacteroidota bacterium]
MSDPYPPERLTPEQWARLDALLDVAFDLDGEARAAYLDEACGGDPALRAEAEALLAADDAAETFLARRAIDEVDDGLLDTTMGGDGADALAALVGRRVGPYRLVRELGRGGMGAVYLAERIVEDGRGFEQSVALKLIAAPHPTLRQRFLAERQTLARLQHPGIARLLDGGVAGLESGDLVGTPFFALEVVDGEPITEHVATAQLGMRDRLDLFLQVCDAVAYAHQNLVVHRDLKPSNILVAPTAGADTARARRGRAKLLDFGIAKLLTPDGPSDLNDDAPLTATGSRVYTPQYAAPEQVRGEAVTTATDVYALGLILYELLTGRRAYHFARTSAGEIERVICETEPLRPSTAVVRLDDDSPPLPVDTTRLRRRLRGDLDTIVLKALAKDPARRYASAEALATDLRRHLAGQPIAARPATKRYRLVKWVRRNPAWAVAAVLVAGLALVATVFAGVVVRHNQLLAAERDRVEREASRTEAVTEFLVGVFQVADPSESRGASVTAQELLDQGAQRLRTELADAPLVQAEVQGVVGRVYTNLGLYDQADSLLTAAVDQHEALMANGDPLAGDALAENLERLGLLRYEQGVFDEAMAHLERALTLRLRETSPDALALARTRHLLGMLVHESGDLVRADSLFQASLAVREEQAPPQDFAATLSSLGLLRSDAGTYDEAEPILQRALALQREHLGADHPETATTLYHLAQLYWTTGRLDEAEPLFRESLALSIQLFGPESASAALDYNQLGLVLVDQGRYDESEAAYEEALQIQRALFGDGHPDLSSTVLNLGALHFAQERYAEAEAAYREALRLDLAAFGNDHPYVAGDRVRLATLLIAQQQPDEAEALLDAVEPVFEATYTPDHPRHADLLMKRASVAHLRGEHAEAEALCRAALDGMTRSLEPDHQAVIDAHATLGLLLVAQDDAAKQREGQAILVEYLPPLRALLGSQHSFVQRAEAALAVAVPKR